MFHSADAQFFPTYDCSKRRTPFLPKSIDTSTPSTAVTLNIVGLAILLKPQKLLAQRSRFRQEGLSRIRVTRESTDRIISQRGDGSRLQPLHDDACFPEA